MTDDKTDVDTARHRQCYREGEAANDHNHGVYRRAAGVTKGNPYEVGSDDWKAWRDGYARRDMVNIRLTY